MANCSDEFPNTDVYYSEISSDTLSVVLLVTCCILVAICLALFVEEIVFLHRANTGDDVKIRKHTTLLGLFPLIGILSLLSILVPTCTTLVDLTAACYLSLSIYTFSTMIIDYFGGEAKMIETMKDETFRLATPPCCCFCFCILKPITLSERSLLYIKLCALQVTVVRPVVLFIAAVLWTDGKYKKDLGSVSSAYLYISVISGISTLVSVYGLVVMFRGTRLRLQHHRINYKFLSLQLAIIILNLQNMIFNFLGSKGIPECIGSRGPKVRANAMNHALLVIEMFLLSLLARRGYRIEEPNYPAIDKDKTGFENVVTLQDEKNHRLNVRFVDRGVKL